LTSLLQVLDQTLTSLASGYFSHHHLQSINSLLPQRVAYVPIAFSDATFAIVTRIPETDAHVFSTKARVPYLAAFVQVGRCKSHHTCQCVTHCCSLILAQEPQPKFCSDPFSSGMRGALQGAGMILSDAANSARAKASKYESFRLFSHLTLIRFPTPPTD
jgi:hypothetical protein